MGTASRIGRLGMLAVGLGIGAAMAATPGIASATSDIDISINGVDIFNGGGSAVAHSGMGDMAIAFGPHSDAVAEGGFGDFASAFSTGSDGAQAVAGDEAVGASGNNFDFASAVGNESLAKAGDTSGAFPGTSSFDFARAAGGNGAGAGSFANAGFNGSGDFASAVGENTQSTAGFSADAAAPANFDSASILGNLFAPTTDRILAIAGGSSISLGGSDDSAFVVDPFGTIGSTAEAGLGHNFDLAGALGDNLAATATSADFLVHILPFF